MTALSINESLFYIPFDHTGVISVCIINMEMN